MPRWVAYLALTAIVLTLFLGLARLSQSVVQGDGPPGTPDSSGSDPGSQNDSTDVVGSTSAEAATSTADDATATGDAIATGDVTASRRIEPTAEPPSAGERTPDTEGKAPGTDAGDDSQVESVASAASDEPVESKHAGATRSIPTETADRPTPGEFGTGALLVNVAATQGLVGVVLAGGLLYFEIPLTAVGLSADPWVGGLPALGVGLAFGTVLWLGNEVAASVAEAVGATYDEHLRELLAPDSTGGWIVLLGLVLPTIAAVEELLFRASLVGVAHAGLGVSPWILVVLSSVAFAIGHGAQGRVGIAVTGVLGFVLAAGFVVTGSFLVVVVAHYLVNALEFLVHEWLGVDRLLA